MMKKFLILCCEFIIATSLTYMIFEAVIRHIPNDYSYKAHWLNNNSSSLEILFIGASNTFFGIKPDLFSGYKCFNAAHVSQSLKYDYLIIKKVIDRADSLRLIFLTISYDLLQSNLDDEIESWRVPNYTFYDYTWVDFCNASILYVNKSNFVKFVLDYYLYNKDNIYCDSLGWFDSFKDAPYSENGYERIKYHTKINNQYFELNKDYIIKINKLCEEHDVSLVFITTPTNITYYSNMDSTQWGLTTDFINNIIKQDSTVKWFNLLTDERFTENDFGDSDHLNKYGAVKLSKILNDTIKGIINNNSW